jgi:hypothetical protein
MVDDVVWAPGRVAGSSLAARIGAGAGDAVTVAVAPASAAVDAEMDGAALRDLDADADLGTDGRLGYLVTGMGGSK